MQRKAAKSDQWCDRLSHGVSGWQNNNTFNQGSGSMGMVVDAGCFDSLEDVQIEVDGKWHVYMVNRSGLRVGEAQTMPMSFMAAMAFCRGYFSNSIPPDLVDGLVPVPFLVDQPKPNGHGSHMVGPELTFTRSCPSSAHVDQVNQELSQEAELSAANNY